MSKKVSIIIPVYNVEKYLRQCLDSIIRQSYRNFEAILIDDGSSDNSGIICDEYATFDKRFRVVHKENGGQSHARNIALSMATGDYLCFVDSDDYISSDFLDNVTLIEKYNVDVVKCGYTLFGDDSRDFHQENRLIADSNDLFKYWMTTDSYLWNRIYRREIFNGHSFEEGMIMEDVFLMPDLLKGIKSMYLTSQGMYFYRIRKTSTIGKPHTPQMLRDILNAYLKYIDVCYESCDKSLFLKYYATYLAGYFETKANFRNIDFSDIRKRFTRYEISFFDVANSSLPFKQKIKMFCVLSLGLDTVAYLYAPFFHHFHPKAIKA